MSDVELEEIESLQREFEWVLTTEVKSVLKQLKEAVKVSFREVLTLTVLPKCLTSPGVRQPVPRGGWCPGSRETGPGGKVCDDGALYGSGRPVEGHHHCQQFRA